MRRSDLVRRKINHLLLLRRNRSSREPLTAHGLSLGLVYLLDVLKLVLGGAARYSSVRHELAHIVAATGSQNLGIMGQKLGLVLRR